MNQNIKFSGHTMGAPKWDIYEVIRRFREIGYDGIEVRIAEDGQINSETVTDGECAKILAAAKKEGMAFSCMTSYYKNFVKPEERAHTIKNLRRVVEIAALLECPLVRVYGGQEANELLGIWFTDVWSATVSGIREVAEYAAKFGVRLCIETHVGSLTMSVRDTVRMVEDVNMHNVGILFDYAWVELAGVEKGREAVRAAARHILNVRNYTTSVKSFHQAWMSFFYFVIMSLSCCVYVAYFVVLDRVFVYSIYYGAVDCLCTKTAAK